MKKIFLFAIVLLFNCSLFSQTPSENTKVDNSKKDFGIDLNFFNQPNKHSGVEIGMESSIWKNVIMSYHVGFYFINNDRTDVSLYWEMGYRKSFKNGFSPELSAGIGYLTTYVPENSDSDKEVLEIVYMPSVTLGALGYDFRKTKNIPLRIYANALLYWKKPIGKSGKEYTGVQVGATYFLR